MTPPAQWNLDRVRVYLEDWDGETADTPRDDVERCLEAAGFVRTRLDRGVDMWRNPSMHRPYWLNAHKPLAPAGLVAQLRDDLRSVLSRAGISL